MFSDPFPYGEKIERRDAIKKVNTSLDPPDHDMVDDAGSIKAS
jgi:hypothetical protein